MSVAAQVYDIHCIDGHDLIVKDVRTSDPYLKFYLKTSGPSSAVQSNVIKSNLNPVWDQHLTLQALDIADTIVVELYDQDKVGSDDSMMDPLEFPLQSISPQAPIDFDKEIQLKGKAAGRLHFTITCITQGATEQQPAPGALEAQPAVSYLDIHLVKATNLIKADANASDPYVLFYLKSEGKDKGVKSKVIDNDLNPVWDQHLALTAPKQDDSLIVEMWDEDISRDDSLMDPLECPINAITKETPLNFDQDIKRKGKDAGHLEFHVYCVNTPGEVAAPVAGQSVQAADIYLDIHAIKGDNLLKLDANASDPYLLFYFKNSGKDKGVKTNVIKDNLNPVWDQHLALHTSEISDTLVVEMWDEDISKPDPMMDPLEFPVVKITPGNPLLFDRDIKRKDKEAGHLQFNVRCVDKQGKEVAPTQKQLYYFDIHAVKGTNLIKADANASDPYMVFYLKNVGKDAAVKTQVIDNNLNPVWNKHLALSTNDPSESICVELWDKDIKYDDSLMDPLEYPVTSITPENPINFDKDIERKGKPAGHLEFHIYNVDQSTPAYQSRSINLEPGQQCHFQWGDDGSTFSTSFTGYTECSKTLDDILQGQDFDHVHEVIVPDAEAKPPKPKKVEEVDGILVQCDNLATLPDEPLNIYATVQLIGRSAIGKGKGTLVQTDNQNSASPVFNKEFKLEKGKLGDGVQVVVYQQHSQQGVLRIGTARIPIHDVTEGPNPPQPVNLLKPRKFNGENALEERHDSYGTVTISLNRHESFVEPEQPAAPQADQPATLEDNQPVPQ